MTDDRAVRALTDVVAVEEYAPGMARVVTWSDDYILDTRGEGCNCPDKEYHDAPVCKHEYAAMLATNSDYPTPYVTEIMEREDGECTHTSGDLPCFDCFEGSEDTAEA